MAERASTIPVAFRGLVRADPVAERVWGRDARTKSRRSELRPDSHHRRVALGGRSVHRDRIRVDDAAAGKAVERSGRRGRPGGLGRLRGSDPGAWTTVAT